MRGTTEDTIKIAFAMLLGVFVILGIYFFGTTIFNAGARINIVATGEGGCACKDAAGTAAKVKCVGDVEAPCGGTCTTIYDLFLPKCDSKQTINLEKALPFEVDKIKICTILATGTPTSRTKIKINDKEISEVLKGKEDCVTHTFDKPTRIKNVEADSRTNAIDRFVVSWESQASTSK